VDTRSYYDQPVVRAPHWRRAEIGGYLFLGGLAGGSSLLGAGADRCDLPILARRTKLVAATAIIVALGALVRDLGRPARFVNMLRTFKPTSPMNMGSWLLTLYAPAAIGAAAFGPREHVRLGRVASTSAALLAPAVAAYTAVLLGDTAVPAWHEAADLPFAFVASSAMAAGGVAVALVPASQTAPARRLAIAGCVGELAAMERVRRQLGDVGATYERGVAGQLLRAGRVLSVGGAAAAVLGRSRRWVAAGGGVGMAAGSLLFRLAVFEAGRASADDPRFTVAPQRRRLMDSAASSTA
jgi:formate-dependent nitrite reductase membrane component NrfD